MLLLLLLSIPQKARRRQRAALPVLLAAVLLCVVPVSAILPAVRHPGNCPYLACARERRGFCHPGSSRCGPCLNPFVENVNGYCVLPDQHGEIVPATDKQPAEFSHDKLTPYWKPDDEIDYLQSILEKQQVAEIQQPKKQPKHDAAPSSQTAPRHATAAAPISPALPDTTIPKPVATAVMGRVGPVVGPPSWKDNIIVITVGVCVAVASIAVIVASVCYVKLQKKSRLAEKVDYPAFGGVGAPSATTNGTSTGDKTLAQSAQMYHYQHQKQQMLSMGNHEPEQKSRDTEVTSDEEDVGGDFTVYECPGLAPTGEMEVKNPLFDDSDLHYHGNHK